MKRTGYFAAVCGAGLLSAQILFSFLVYFFSLAHYHKLSGLKAAGYLIVPNDHILPSLLRPGPALAGGLFFTLTAGAGLTLLTFGVIFLWRWFLFEWRFGLVPVIAAGAGLLYWINRGGVNCPITAIFILLAAAVSAAAIILFPKTAAKTGSKTSRMIFHSLILVILAGIWIPQADSHAFIRIRDYLLLSNPAGSAINRFYYQYTLFPAYVFKSQDQRLLHTCRIFTQDPHAFSIIERQLRKKDYLLLSSGKAPVDLAVIQKRRTLSFMQGGRTIYTAGMERFIKSPGDVLSAVSKKTDNFRFFRKFTFYSLVMALPLMGYGIIYFCALLLFFWVKNSKTRTLLSLLAVLSAGVLLVLPLYQARGNPASHPQISAGLFSDDWKNQLAALEQIEETKLPVSSFSGIEALTNSSHVPVRYWLARALGDDDSNQAHRLALAMLSDPQPNVVSMALYSLGRQDRTSAIPRIVDLIKTSDHWYVQWYAYHALKRLGWIQPRSVFSRRSSR